MTIDYTKLLAKLDPQPGGEDVARMRTGIVDAVNADGTVDLGISGIVVPDVPVLQGAYVSAGATVNVISYRGSLIVIGGTHTGAVPVMAFNSGIGTVTGLTFALPTTANIGLTFIAPASGAVRLDFSAELDSATTTGSHIILSPRVLTGSTIGSGSVVLAPSDQIALRFRNNVTAIDVGVSNFYRLDGLTPGASYNAQMYGRINASAPATGRFELQRLLVSPSE